MYDLWVEEVKTKKAWRVTNEEAINHGKEQLEIFGGEHKEFIELAIKAIEKVETYEKMMDELLEPKYGDYIQHKFTHEYGDVVMVEDLRYTFEEARRSDE